MTRKTPPFASARTIRSSLFLAVFLITAALPAHAQTRSDRRDESEDSTTTRPLPEEVRRNILNVFDDVKSALVNAIFDALDEVSLPSIRPRGKANLHLGANVRREVYDNYDLTGTWTVIDRVEARVDAKPLSVLTTLAEGGVTPSFGTPYIGVVFEPTASLKWSNVRQVAPPKLRDLPTPSEIEQQLSVIPDPDLSETNPYTPFYLIDPSIRARFGKIWNPFTFPFRSPITIRGAKNLEIGEVVSYGVQGAVEVGINAGFAFAPNPSLGGASIGARATVIVEGEFQISILKEDARFVKVKLSRRTKKGRALNVKVSAEAKDILKGKIVAFNPGVDIRIVPFELNVTTMNSKQFDVVYRYDLENPASHRAYLKAVLGSFTDSERVAADAARPLDPGQLEEGTFDSMTDEELALRDARASDGVPAIEQVFERRSKSKSIDTSRKFKLSFFFQKSNQKGLEDLEAVITSPEGTRTVHRALSDQETSKSGVVGNAKELATRKFTVLLDEDKYKKNEADSLFVIAENFFEDSRTKPKEIRRITTEIEEFLNRPNLFPDLPDRIPDLEHPERTRRAYYGQSSFYYGVTLDRKKIEILLSVPESKREEWVEAAFVKHSGFLDSLPLSGRRRKKRQILEAWAAASDAHRKGDMLALYAALRDFFDNRRRGKEMMELLKIALEKNDLDYFVNAQNIAFGRVQERGKITTPVEKLMTETDEYLGFEGVGRRARADAEAVIQEITTTEDATGKITLSFKLSHEPKILFLRLTRSSALKRALILREITLLNAGKRFHLGENHLVLDPKSTDELTHKVAGELRQGEHYTIHIGFSRDGKKTGPAGPIRFLATPFYPKELHP